MPAPAERPLRFGVMCSGPMVEAAFAASVRELLGTDGVELALVIVDEQRARALRLPRTLWDGYLRLRPPHAISSSRPVDLADAFSGVPHVDARDVESIRGHQLDFVLRRGSGAVGGDLLDVPTHGVWSFHRSDDERFRGGPAGFWEISLREPATGAILQRLTEQADAGVVLQRCFVSTNPASHRTTLDAVTWAATYMPALVAREILNGSARYLDAPASATGAPTSRAPTGVQVVRFLGRLGRAWIRAQLASVFLLERWHVGIVRRPVESFLEEGFQPEIEWLPRRKAGGFLADPFLVGGDSARRMLVEEWDDRSGRGTIAEVDLEEGLRGSAPRTAIDAGCHMAYPFTFEHDGRLLCAPESYQRRGVFLYAFDPVGQRWTEHATLLEGVAAVDPTLVHHGGRWWLFHTDHDEGPEDKLFLWSSLELLGPWEPHPGNPVKADVRSSRPAGTPFVFEGELYRPAQDSAGGYGRAVVINRVTRLTTTEFAEERVARFPPPPGSPFRDGFHTLAGLDDLTAVDGKRMAPAPRLVVPRILRKLRRLAEKAQGR